MSFAVLNLILSVLASITYIGQGDLRHAVYWGAAAVITAAVTF